MNRGILSTIYVRGLAGRSSQDLHAILDEAYDDEPFVRAKYLFSAARAACRKLPVRRG
jgi:N-acetyl-gamma-glutamylphosphate reductase